MGGLNCQTIAINLIRAPGERVTEDAKMGPSVYRARPCQRGRSSYVQKSCSCPCVWRRGAYVVKEATRGRRFGWKRLALLAVAVLVIAVTTGVANATTKINVDAGWQSFITGGGVDGASTAGPWVFTNTTVTKVTVTDAFCRGDEFRVYDKDVLIGQTSEVESDFPACPFELFFPAEARADAALADPGFSHGVFYLAPGSHAIEFENKALWSETSSGTGAFFRLDSTTITKNDCRNNGWANYGLLFKNQGQCMSQAA